MDSNLAVQVHGKFSFLSTKPSQVSQARMGMYPGYCLHTAAECKQPLLGVYQLLPGPQSLHLLQGKLPLCPSPTPPAGWMVHEPKSETRILSPFSLQQQPGPLDTLLASETQCPFNKADLGCLPARASSERFSLMGVNFLKKWPGKEINK